MPRPSTLSLNEILNLLFFSPASTALVGIIGTTKAKANTPAKIALSLFIVSSLSLHLSGTLFPL